MIYVHSFHHFTLGKLILDFPYLPTSQPKQTIFSEVIIMYIKSSNETL